MRENTPERGLSTTSRPNGHRAYPAMRKDAMPNGMVTISRQQMIPASMYPSHSPNPAKMTQMMFSSVFIGPSFRSAAGRWYPAIP
jgi:hypothetical protein